MNQKIILFLLLTIFSSILFGFKVGDEIELQAYLNGRSSAEFLKTSNNFEEILAKGTKGEILESKKFNSGNFGLKLKIENGPKAGQSYWVYYNIKTPQIKFLDQKEKPLPESEVAQAKKAVLQNNQMAIRAPEEKVIQTALIMASGIISSKGAQDLIPAIPKDPCTKLQTPLSDISEDQYNESELVAPYREKANSKLHSNSCSDKDSGWTLCKSILDNKIEGFKLTNGGPNSIVKTNEYYISREMSFEFEDRAKSDMRLLITDAPDDTTSHATYSVLMFFPRKNLPSIKKSKNELFVTLPNGEEVRYNAKTHEVIGGVFSEGPIKQDPKNKNKAIPADIKYTGEGVVIRADKSGDLPYESMATISKKGFKDCKISGKEIWYTDSSKENNIFIKPEYANDQGLDKLLKTKCGFSIQQN